jgi:hypothetical protein
VANSWLYYGGGLGHAGAWNYHTGYLKLAKAREREIVLRCKDPARRGCQHDFADFGEVMRMLKARLGLPHVDHLPILNTNGSWCKICGELRYVSKEHVVTWRPVPRAEYRARLQDIGARVRKATKDVKRIERDLAKHRKALERLLEEEYGATISYIVKE